MVLLAVAMRTEGGSQLLKNLPPLLPASPGHDSCSQGGLGDQIESSTEEHKIM